MELSANDCENDRANIVIGQPAEIQFDALPGTIFHGVLKSAGAMVQRTFFWEDVGSKYDVSIQLTDPNSRLLPGLTAQIVILGTKEQKVLYIPRQALFQKEGSQTVFLRKGASFEQIPVKVHLENETRAAIEGLKEGDEVALIDPTAPRKGGPSGGAPALGGGTP
jgi:hypothetical protein